MKRKYQDPEPVQEEWGLLTTTWPAEFTAFVPKKGENDHLKAGLIFFIDVNGITVGQAKSLPAAMKLLESLPGGTLRPYDPTVAEREEENSQRRQLRRYQSLGTGPARNFTDLF